MVQVSQLVQVSHANLEHERLGDVVRGDELARLRDARARAPVDRQHRVADLQAAGCQRTLYPDSI